MAHQSFVTRDRCPVCDAAEQRILYRCPYGEDPVLGYVRLAYGQFAPSDFSQLAGAEYVLVECPSCGFVFQRDIPTEAMLHIIYEDWLSTANAYEYERDYTLNEYVTRAREILLLIRSFGVKPRFLRFLDVGMGWGTWCLMAKSFGVDAAGIELSDTRVRFARSNGITALTWDQLADESFDVINADQVFEHLAEPLPALRRLHGCLKDGGIVALSVPNGGKIARALGRGRKPAPADFQAAFNPSAPLEHINCFSYRSLLALAARAGFRRLKLPLGLQYRSIVLGSGAIRVAKDLLRPLYFALGSPTAILLQKAPPEGAQQTVTSGTHKNGRK